MTKTLRNASWPFALLLVRRTTVQLEALALLAGSLLVAAAPAAVAQPEEPGARGPAKAELRRALLGPDRDARREAFREAMDRGGLDEEVWLDLLDRHFGTPEEEEEACYFAASGLAQTGTRRCLPRLHQLMQREPTVLRPYEGDERGDPTTMVPKYPYRSAAVLAYRQLSLQAPLEEAKAQLEDLPHARQAELLTAWLSDKAAGYDTFRRPGEPEEEPMGWISRLVNLAGELGPRSATALADAVEELAHDPDRQGAITGAFARVYTWEPYEEVLEAQPELGEVGSQTPEQKEEAWTRFRAEVPPAVRAAAVRIARAGLQTEPPKGLSVVRRLRLVEVERDLIGFLRRTRLDRRSTLTLSSRPLEERVRASRNARAVGALASLRTETAIDFLLYELHGTGLRRVLEPADLAERYLRALEREAETPGTQSFRSFARGVGSPARAEFGDLERLASVRERAEAVVEDLDDPEQRRSAAAGLRLLEETIQWVREAKAKSADGQGESR